MLCITIRIQSIRLSNAQPLRLILIDILLGDINLDESLFNHLPRLVLLLESLLACTLGEAAFTLVLDLERNIA